MRSLDVEIRRLPAAASIITPPGTWQFLWSKAAMTELSTLSTANHGYLPSRKRDIRLTAVSLPLLAGL
jgi:hypothetical protein